MGPIICTQAARWAEIREPAIEGIATGDSRRKDLEPDLGAFWRSVSEGKRLRAASNGRDMQRIMSLIFGEPARNQDYIFLRAGAQLAPEARARYAAVMTRLAELNTRFAQNVLADESGFVLPLGYTFNLDGTTLYLSMASVFVAQAAGVDLTIGQEITMMLTLMLTSKGVAGVPRASLVILAGTLASYNLPLEGVTLILGVDAVMDMARTSVNVVGNCLATVVITKWEGEYDEDRAQAVEVS